VNLAAIIDPHPTDAVAIISANEVITYGALREQVAAFRGGLVKLGVEPGDRVAIAMANNWYFVVAYLAALGVGAVVVPLNPQSPTLELEGELKSVEPRVVCVGPTSSDAFAGIDRVASGIVSVIVPEGVVLPDSVSFEDLVVSDAAPLISRSADDLAVLMFTSGTAGAPKAAMLTHGNLLANIENVQATQASALTSSDSLLGALPLFHIYGLNGALGQSLFVGASLLLVQRFDPLAALQSIRERSLTVVVGVPPMFESWVALPLAEATRRDFESVRITASGASKLDPKLAREFYGRFGKHVGEGYGLTEASPVVTTADFTGERIGTIGLPVPGVQVRLVDHEGQDTLVGDPGEIWVKGANVFPGYWHDDEATQRALTTDGWLRTGDIAVADKDGYLVIVDREKDLIIVSGFNVYPAEVEEALALHPGVAGVAVVGSPHPHSGETVKAFVVAKPDRMLEEDDLIAFCGQHLARYKCPTKITFVSELPYGLSGKLIRRGVRGL
jgi:long-chain acyl-CoA synthetase